MQVEPLQLWVAPQALPQLPQLSWSLGTQAPLHSSVPVGQTHLPVTQDCPAAQVVAQLPQWAGSFWRSAQAPLQSVSPLPQVVVQLPALQTALAAQVFPQAPQLLGSVCSLTQAPLHSCSGALQAHWELTHGWPGEQVLPQAPQFDGSSVSLTQLAPHWVWPLEQLETHCELEQLSPVGQTLPQAPQLEGSLVVSTQPPPLQRVVPPVQPLTQWPAWQSGIPSGQALPQPPQFFGSLSVATHLPSQSVCSAAQLHWPALQLWPAPQAKEQLPQWLASV